jgi:hypothetical protein
VLEETAEQHDHAITFLDNKFVMFLADIESEAGVMRGLSDEASAQRSKGKLVQDWGLRERKDF